MDAANTITISLAPGALREFRELLALLRCPAVYRRFRHEFGDFRQVRFFDHKPATAGAGDNVIRLDLCGELSDFLPAARALAKGDEHVGLR